MKGQCFAPLATVKTKSQWSSICVKITIPNNTVIALQLLLLQLLLLPNRKIYNITGKITIDNNGSKQPKHKSTKHLIIYNKNPQ